MADNFDKFLPDWQIGTLTLSANSTAFTATDALLTFGSIQQGDFIISPDGRMLVIESITDDDNGVLSTPCPPEAAGTFQTRIRYQSDNSRYTGQTAALRRLLSGGNLFALSKLAGDPETIVRFLANGSFDLVDPATFGIQDPNGSLGKLAELIFVADKALVTDAAGNIEQIDLGTLGRALLALQAGTTAQIIQADGAVIDKASLPVSTAMQNALNDKLSVSLGGILNGALRVNNALYTYINQTGGNQYSNQVSCFIGDGIASRFMAEHAPGYYYATLIQTAFPGGSREFLFKSDGSFTAPGAIIGAAKNFEIDHTVDPDNYDLRHCATEAPEMLVEYRGTAQLVNGNASINVEEYFGVMSGTFDALWTDAWVTALQNQDSFDRLKPSRIEGAVFTISCENQNSNDLVSWVVMARRKDAYVRWDGCKSTDANGKLIIEFEKESA